MKNTKAKKIPFTAPVALDRIDIKRMFPEEVKDHATVTLAGKKVRLIDIPDDIRLLLPIHISIMSGKLFGVNAISTTCVVNAECLRAMNDPTSPCFNCFAAKTAAQYNALREHLENNYRVLNGRELTDDECNALCAALAKSKGKSGRARIEPFGDVGSVQHARNYIKIIRAGAAYGLYFGAWTKLPHIWNAAFAIDGKPENMTFMYSAPALNQTEAPVAECYSWIDNVFMVAEKAAYEQTAQALLDAGKILHRCKCEKGSCMNNDICGYCYRSDSRRENHGNKIAWIIEALRK